MQTEYIQRYIEEKYHKAPDSVTGKTKLADIGLDSLDIFELFMDFERMSGRRLPEKKLKSIRYVKDFESLTQERPPLK